MANLNWEKANRQQLVKQRGSTPLEKINKTKKCKKKLEFIKMSSKFEGKCVTCEEKIFQGKVIKYFPKLKVATHYNCKNPKSK